MKLIAMDKILEKIREIREITVRLGNLEDVLRLKDLNEKTKNGVEDACWKLVGELNKLTERYRKYETTS